LEDENAWILAIFQKCNSTLAAMWVKKKLQKRHKNVPLFRIFLQNVLSFRIKAVPLHQQNPPRFPKTSEPGRGVFFI